MNRFLHLVLGISHGVAHDQLQRRHAMTALIAAALAMLAAGLFPLWGVFAAHPLFFAIYWLICAWLTTCAMLLAIYDLVLVVQRGRRERAATRRRIFQPPD